eukprot:g61586.t1
MKDQFLPVLVVRTLDPTPCIFPPDLEKETSMNTTFFEIQSLNASASWVGAEIFFLGGVAFWIFLQWASEFFNETISKYQRSFIRFLRSERFALFPMACLAPSLLCAYSMGAVAFAKALIGVLMLLAVNNIMVPTKRANMTELARRELAFQASIMRASFDDLQYDGTERLQKLRTYLPQVRLRLLSRYTSRILEFMANEPIKTETSDCQTRTWFMEAAKSLRALLATSASEVQLRVAIKKGVPLSMQIDRFLVSDLVTELFLNVLNTKILPNEDSIVMEVDLLSEVDLTDVNESEPGRARLLDAQGSGPIYGTKTNDEADRGLLQIIETMSQLAGDFFIKSNELRRELALLIPQPNSHRYKRYLRVSFRLENAATSPLRMTAQIPQGTGQYEVQADEPEKTPLELAIGFLTHEIKIACRVIESIADDVKEMKNLENEQFLSLWLVFSDMGTGNLGSKYQRCHSILYYTILYYTILYYTILYYTILYYTILYYTILHYTTILFYTILYYTILYYTILYYTILYYTILYYTILYYTILYYTTRAMKHLQVCNTGLWEDVPQSVVKYRASAVKPELLKFGWEDKAVPFSLQDLISTVETLAKKRMSKDRAECLRFTLDQNIPSVLNGHPSQLMYVLSYVISTVAKTSHTFEDQIHFRFNPFSGAFIEGGTRIIRNHLQDQDIAINMVYEDPHNGSDIRKFFKTVESLAQVKNFGAIKDVKDVGMALSCAILKSMNAEVVVRQTPPGEVSCILQIVVPFASESVAGAQIESLEPGMIAQTRKERMPVNPRKEVLIVDDNATIRKLMVRRLKRMCPDLLIAEASDGKIGVEVIKNRKKTKQKFPDLIFMDLEMPVLNGFGAMRELQTIGCTSIIGVERPASH